MNRSINTLATPLINRTEQRTELNATPKLKANLCVWTDEMTSRKDTLGSVQEKEPAIEKTSSLEIHLSLDAENEGEKKWNIDMKASLMVGDKAADMQAALAAGVAVRILVGKDGHARPESIPECTGTAKNLLEAVELIK